MIASLAKRGVAAILTTFVIAACSPSIAKNARDDRSKDPTGEPDPGTTAGTPVGTGGPARCTDATAGTEKQPVYLMFVVDASNSMSTENKWTSVLASMNLIIDQMTDGNVAAAGMIVYGDKNDPTDPCKQGTNTCATAPFGPYPSSADIPIRYVDGNHAGALKARLANTQPEFGTPTLLAMEGGYQALRAFQPAAPLSAGGKKILVLITDSTPLSRLDQATEIATCLTRAQEEAQSADPILTFAVGVGSFPGDGYEYDSNFVGRLAYYGGTARFPGCNPTESVNEANVCHFQVTPNQKTAEQVREEAINAINAIRQNITSCSFHVNEPPNGFQLDTRSISVRHKAANGTVSNIAPGTTNGWSVDSAEKPKTVTLNGDACRQYRESGGSVEVLLACR
jgi:hypothetical protein